MGFVKVEDAGNSSNLLYLSNCESDTAFQDKVCYVLNGRGSIAKNQKGFYGFNLKTADCKVVHAVIFDVPDFIESGLKIKDLENSLVKISGYVSEYRSGVSLILNKIEKCSSEELMSIDSKKFLGEIENVSQMFSDVQEFVEMIDKSLHVPSVYKIKSYPRIYGGRLGGYVKFIWKWMYSISVFNDFNDGVINRVFYNCVVNYANYLDRLNVMDIVTTLDKVQILRSIPDDNSIVSAVTLDTMQAILGLGESEHLYAKIIYECFSQINTISYMNELWDTLPNGGAKELECGILRKYQ